MNKKIFFLMFGILFLFSSVFVSASFGFDGAQSSSGFGFDGAQSNTSNIYIINGTSVLHNNLSGLQGGVTGEYYHIRQSWYDELNTDIFNWITQTEGDGRYLQSYTETDPIWISDKASYVPYTGATSNLDLGVNDLIVNTDQLYVDTTTGYTGIGTSSPSEALDVNGNINIADGQYYKYGGQNALRLAKGTDTSYVNTFVGAGAGNSSATRQTAIGYYAGKSNTGSRQTAVGMYTGQSNSGVRQTAIGYQAGYSNSGARQTALGYNTGNTNSGDYQTALGYYAGYYNTGARQTAIGYLTGYQNSGTYQTSIGYSAGYQNSGTYQTSLGYSAGYKNTGTQQTAFGYSAGYQNTGTYQTSIGYLAGYLNEGDSVIGIGSEATRNNSASDVVAIGYRAGKDNTVANQFIVKQANINAVPLIQGDFATGDVTINGGLNVTGDFNISYGYTGYCVNTTYSGGIAISCND